SRQWGVESAAWLIRELRRSRTGCFVSSEDAWRRGSFIARIRRPSWLNQQDVDLTPCHRPMFDSSGHHKNLAREERDCAVPQLNVERSAKDKKEIVRLVMFVPVERPFELGHHDVVVVVSGNSAGREALGELFELFGEIGWSFHHFSRP